MLGVEKVIQWMLRPLLKLVGIGKEAITITLVGITLGIAFGGGLLIKTGYIWLKEKVIAVWESPFLFSRIFIQLVIILVIIMTLFVVHC